MYLQIQTSSKLSFQADIRLANMLSKQSLSLDYQTLQLFEEAYNVRLSHVTK